MKKFLIILTMSLCLIIGVSYLVGSVIVPLTQSNNVSAVFTATTTSENKVIQQRLKKWGYYSGAIDGILGPKSVSAIKRFQKNNGLVVDGIVGPKTAAKIGITLSSNSSNPSKQSSSDLYLLAKCVHAEARGESYQGQVAVAAVILNRVKSPDFPNSIAGVIYQPWAFTAVHDGQINLEPNQTAYNAARDAMNGWDPTYGSLYYYNPATATSKWIYSRQTVVQIGKHVFAL
ncbi:MAG: spore cortex-lytic enzyme [Clostridia bacterium]|nr:spore cortex-lytic enzyme [Clostridia bacterium]